MKKLLGIVVLVLLWFSTAHAIPKWIGNPVKVCKINQDIDLSLVWLEEGKVEEKEDFSLKKGDYITLNERTNKDQKWYVTPNNVFPSKDKPKWHKLEVRGRSEKVKKKDFIVDCKKIDYKKIDYKSYTAASFNEIFNNKYKYYGSKPVALSGELYLPKKEGKFPVVYIQHGTGHPKGHINFI